MMDPRIVLAVSVGLIGTIGVVATRIVVKRRNASVFHARVEDFIPLSTPVATTVVQTAQNEETGRVVPVSIENWLRPKIELAGWNVQPEELALRCLCIFSVSLAVLFTFSPFGLPIAFVVAALLASVPLVLVNFQAGRTRHKLELQLPNALDLMVSVLRSGHAVPQSIKAVATEMPNPCGREFGEVLHRVNLGQPLPEALTYTVVRYRSFELDLLRRAFQIHADVGGSLAELLDKTNTTLRGRIKLKRHVDVLTAPSKLTSIIVAILPFAVAGGCYALAPSYLDPLVKTNIGHVFIALGLILQVVGLLIMRRMATFKV